MTQDKINSKKMTKSDGGRGEGKDGYYPFSNKKLLKHSHLSGNHSPN